MPWGEKASCPWPPEGNDCEYSAWHGIFPSNETMTFQSMMTTDEGAVQKKEDMTIGVAIVIAWICITVCMFMGTSMSTSDKDKGSTKDDQDPTVAEIEMNSEREVKSPLTQNGEKAKEEGEGFTGDAFRPAAVRQTSDAGEEEFSIDEHAPNKKGGRNMSLDVEEI